MEDEATDLGLRTSYSTVVAFFFLVVASDVPGRGAGSGFAGIYCNRDRNVRSANHLMLVDCAAYLRRETWPDVLASNLLLLFSFFVL